VQFAEEAKFKTFQLAIRLGYMHFPLLCLLLLYCRQSSFGVQLVHYSVPILEMSRNSAQNFCCVPNIRVNNRRHSLETASGELEIVNLLTVNSARLPLLPLSAPSILYPSCTIVIGPRREYHRVWDTGAHFRVADGLQDSYAEEGDDLLEQRLADKWICSVVACAIQHLEAVSTCGRGRGVIGFIVPEVPKSQIITSIKAPGYTFVRCFCDLLKGRHALPASSPAFVYSDDKPEPPMLLDCVTRMAAAVRAAPPALPQEDPAIDALLREIVSGDFDRDVPPPPISGDIPLSEVLINPIFAELADFATKQLNEKILHDVADGDPLAPDDAIVEPAVDSFLMELLAVPIQEVLPTADDMDFDLAML
jgi:hypothetical protein